MAFASVNRSSWRHKHHRTRRWPATSSRIKSWRTGCCHETDRRLGGRREVIRAGGRFPRQAAKPVNRDIAVFANERRPGMTWKAIYYAWKREHPNDRRNKELTPERVRDAWRRHFGGKGQRQSKEMWAK